MDFLAIGYMQYM